jgi:glycosyltransferase involved in cell wall biosynthesis
MRVTPATVEYDTRNMRVAIIIPCLDEEAAIAPVVEDFKRTLPEAEIVVVDNGSTDRTPQQAAAAGARVLREPRRGKARAMARAFSRVDADVVIMVDGDGSYPARGAKMLLDHYRHRPSDMLTGIRVADDSAKAFRPLHQLGTRAFEWALWLAFGYRSRDIFSGLRLFSADFYQNVPVLSRGFEIELELTVQAIDKGFLMDEIEVPFTERTKGTVPKLRGVRDGVRILRFLVLLFRDYRPLWFFGRLALVVGVLGLLAGSLPIYEYIRTGLVGRFPLAFLAASLCVVAILTLQVGIIIEGSLRYQREAFQIRVRHSAIARPRD